MTDELLPMRYIGHAAQPVQWGELSLTLTVYEWVDEAGIEEGLGLAVHEEFVLLCRREADGWHVGMRQKNSLIAFMCANDGYPLRSMGPPRA